MAPFLRHSALAGVLGVGLLFAGNTPLGVPSSAPSAPEPAVEPLRPAVRESSTQRAPSRPVARASARAMRRARLGYRLYSHARRRTDHWRVVKGTRGAVAILRTR